MKKSLYALFGLCLIFIAVKLFGRSFLQNSVWWNQGLNLLYIWSPGFVGLYFAKRDKITLPLFKNIGKGFVLLPLYSLVIAGVSFLLSMAFGLSAELNPTLFSPEYSLLHRFGIALLLFFTGLIIPSLFLGVLFFGGEIFWRGYLWEKFKRIPPFKAIWIIAIIWALWQLPLTFFGYTPGYSAVSSNFAVAILMILIFSPLLFYFRLKYRSLLASTLFYSTLSSSFLWIALLFHKTLELKSLNIYGACGLAVALLVSLALKLYSPKKWDQFAKGA